MPRYIDHTRSNAWFFYGRKKPTSKKTHPGFILKCSFGGNIPCHCWPHSAAMSHFCKGCMCYICERQFEAGRQLEPGNYIVLTHLPLVYPTARLSEDGHSILCGGCALRHQKQTVIGIMRQGKPHIFRRMLTWPEQARAVEGTGAVPRDIVNSDYRAISELGALVSQLREHVDSGASVHRVTSAERSL